MFMLHFFILNYEMPVQWKGVIHEMFVAQIKPPQNPIPLIHPRNIYEVDVIAPPQRTLLLPLIQMYNSS